jgi:zinc/manganese transport system substrate-binding protein
MKFWWMLLGVFVSPAALAKLMVVTTLPDLRSITEEVGGANVSVESIAKGTQDPHYVEAKPSFMVKASHADLIISIGLDLEIGWLPSVIQGARNPKIVKGKPGFLEVGPLVDPLEVPTGSITRAEGDVHPYGNPHINLDPDRMGRAANVIGARLSELDPTHANEYQKNAKALQKRLADKTKLWQHRIDATKIKKIVTYHKTLTYFFARFHLENPAILEPKPGVPPTSGHIIEVINLIKKQHIVLLMIENYFDPSVTSRIKQDVPSIRSETVAVSVDGAPNIRKIDDLYENLVKAIEGK